MHGGQLGVTQGFFQHKGLKQVLSGTTLQDGHIDPGTGSSTTQRVDSVPGSQGRLFARALPSSFSTLSSFCVSGPSFPIYGLSVRT